MLAAGSKQVHAVWGYEQEFGEVVAPILSSLHLPLLSVWAVSLEAN